MKKWDFLRRKKKFKYFILVYFINNFSVVVFILCRRIFLLKVLFKYIK